MIRSVRAVRYITPLREGGSLPAVIEADDEQLYVLKFRGAGQGPKVLIAELLVGELGRALGLPVPEIVLVTLDPAFGRSEPDPEIQALLQSSIGLNLALAYVPAALAFEPALAPPSALALASSIVWFDAYTTNVDRTPRNTNMLLQDDQLWLIDHGAALYMHHTWTDYLGRSTSPFAPIKDHVLLPFADQLREADATFSRMITSELLQQIVEQIPEDWLQGETSFDSPVEHRAAYLTYLERRLAAPRRFVEEAINARG